MLNDVEYTTFKMFVTQMNNYLFVISFQLMFYETLRYRLARPLRLQLHGAIYRPDFFVFMLPYCANLKAIRYESTSFNRIVADKSHRVIAA